MAQQALTVDKVWASAQALPYPGEVRLVVRVADTLIFLALPESMAARWAVWRGRLER